jgi:uncharacterized peroxidase-related enzyme
LSPFKPHTVESAPLASRKLLSGLREQVGFVPNLAATLAESPALLEAFLSLRAIAASGSLDPVARETVAIAVAAETRCAYCVAAHSTFALKNGARAEVVEAARRGAAIDDPRLDALARFARAVVRRQGDGAARVQDLVKAGFRPAQVFDILAVIAVPMLAGSAAHLADVALDPVFEPQAWNEDPDPFTSPAPAPPSSAPPSPR